MGTSRIRVKRILVPIVGGRIDCWWELVGGGVVWDWDDGGRRLWLIAVHAPHPHVL